MNEKRVAYLLAVLLPLAWAAAARAADPSAMGQLQATEQVSQQANQGGSPESQSSTAHRAFDGAGLGSGSIPGSQAPGDGAPQEPKVISSQGQAPSRAAAPAGEASPVNVTPYQEWVDKAKAMMWLAVALLGVAYILGKLFPTAPWALAVSKALCLAAGVAAMVSVWYGLKIMMAGQSIQGTIFMLAGMLLAGISLQSGLGGGTVSGKAVLMALATPLAASVGEKLAKDNEIKE